MSLKRNILSFLFITAFVFCFCAAVDPLDAGKNASMHNNIAIKYLKENNYVGAIKEFQIAIDLNPNHQVTATYYYNLGMLYVRLKKYKEAKDCFENSIRLNPLYFRYYIDTVKMYKELNILDSELTKYLARQENPLSDLYIGLIYIEQGKRSAGITTLDNFCEKEPHLLVTAGVKNYLKETRRKK